METLIVTNDLFSRPLFLADDPALDFLNTMDLLNPLGVPIDWISDGEGFMDWLEQGSMAPASAIKRFREEFSPEELDTLAATARDLREWFNGFIIDHSGKPLQLADSIDMTPLNEVLARDNSFYQIEIQRPSQKGDTPNDSLLSWRQELQWHTTGDLLFPIAKAMGDLICKADFTQIKYCEGSECALWFYDLSKNHTRRWCSMAICGNRAKAAAYRARKRAN